MLKRDELGVLAAIMLCVAVASTHAAVPITLQTCAAPPTTGGVMGCQQVLFAAVAPTTLVRSSVTGVQGWRAFSTLQKADSVYAQDGSWHVLSSITPALLAPPVVIPPVVTPPPAATPVKYTVSWQKNAQEALTSEFSLPSNVTQCFTVAAGTHSAQICLPPNP